MNKNATEENQAHTFLLQDVVDGVGVRVSSKLARKWLHENKAIICGGNVFYLKIKNLGMGVCKITKADLKIRETLMVK